MIKIDSKIIKIELKPSTAMMIWFIIRDNLEVNRKMLSTKKGGMYYANEAQELMNAMMYIAKELDAINESVKEEVKEEAVKDETIS